MVTFKKNVLISLDADLHYKIKMLYCKKQTNLSKEISKFLKSELNHNQR